MQPAPAKTAKKAENYNKEGPIDSTVGESGVSNVFLETSICFFHATKGLYVTFFLQSRYARHSPN